MKQKKERINNFINAPQLRVIDSDGSQIGVISNYEAKQIAKEQELDLVEINGNSNPPICKIMDYGKYLYEKNKKQKQNKQTQIVQKEIRLTSTTDNHDIEFKAKHAKEFLQKNNQVKVSLKFEGRNIVHPEFGKKILHNFLNLIIEYGYAETEPKMEGKKLIVNILPQKKEINLQDKTDIHETVIKYIFSDFYSDKNIRRVLNYLEHSNIKKFTEYIRLYHPKYCKGEVISVNEIAMLQKDLGFETNKPNNN